MLHTLCWSSSVARAASAVVWCGVVRHVWLRFASGCLDWLVRVLLCCAAHHPGVGHPFRAVPCGQVSGPKPQWQRAVCVVCVRGRTAARYQSLHLVGLFVCLTGWLVGKYGRSVCGCAVHLAHVQRTRLARHGASSGTCPSGLGSVIWRLWPTRCGRVVENTPCACGTRKRCR